ncbi:MAG: RsmB/NOP family class I SAM-dependent RNA methyltransferase [Candidatus Bathyarchaeota archaeon]|nr:RsmB/NOP family class I SAM-dependent RNA methyltransferase [Candidatus Bathyarchaeota archaeon]
MHVKVLIIVCCINLCVREKLLRDAWALAIETLCWIELKGLSERLALVKASKQLGIQGPNTIGLAHKLVLETVRRQNFIDYMINSLLKPNSINDFHPSNLAFLRLYTYETKIRGNNGYERAVSIAGIGRSVLGWRRLKEVEKVLGPLLSLKPQQVLEGSDDAEKVSLQMFQPFWFVKYCFKLFGRHEALHIFESTLSNTPTYIRVNTLKMTEEELLKKISCEGIILEKVERLLHTYKVIKNKQPLVRTSSFSNGLFYIQDKASCLAAAVAAPKTGMTVLDVCAAPGAKTTYLAQLMENRGKIFSVDYSKRRTRIWKREIERMGVKIAMPIIGDAYNPLPFHKVEADLVILDPPCTSTGVFSRTPSAKWRLSKRSIRKMAAIQWEMLNNCAELVKKGGSLVYSTCSITTEENEVLIERFLKWNSEFALVETKPRIGLPGLRGQTCSQRLYPHIHESNGFFIAKLVKQA